MVEMLDRVGCQNHVPNFLNMHCAGLLLSFYLGSSAVAQDAISRAETALDVLQTWYNESTGIWNTCGWWNGANCMTIIANLALVDESAQEMAIEVFKNTYIVAPSVNPGATAHGSMVNGVMQKSYPPSWPYRMHDLQSQDSVNATAWLEGSNDDDAWWSLAWIAAFDVTQNQDYLELAMGIFDHLVRTVTQVIVFRY